MPANNDPGHPYNPAAFSRMRAIAAWEKYGDRLTWGKGQCLAILDDGCDLTVPEWQVELPWGPKVIAGYNSIDGNDDPTPVPPGYHGTSVGYPSSLFHNGTVGLAYNNHVAHVRCVSIVHLRSDESTTMSAALDWVAHRHGSLNITAVNLSPLDDQPHREPWPTAIDEPLDLLRRLGIWVSAPCGNNGHTDGISWPACQPACFAIGATKQGSDTVHLDRWANVDLLVPAAATSSSNAFAAAGAMVLREAIEKARYPWSDEAETMPDAIMGIFQMTGVEVHDPDTGLTFRRLDLLSALDHVFASRHG